MLKCLGTWRWHSPEMNRSNYGKCSVMETVLATFLSVPSRQPQSNSGFRQTAAYISLAFMEHIRSIFFVGLPQILSLPSLGLSAKSNCSVCLGPWIFQIYKNFKCFIDFRFPCRLIIVAYSLLGTLQRVDVGNVANISQEHTASIFRSEVSFCVYTDWVRERDIEAGE
jgi:hypothetical protein